MVDELGKLLGFPSKSYERWETLQRLNELTKAIAREWSQARQDEIEYLKEKLSNFKQS